MSERSSTSSAARRHSARVLTILAAAMMLLLPGSDPDTAAAADKKPATGAGTGPIERLHWMTGCWERRSGTRLVEEQWMEPRGGMMLGVSRTVRGDTLVEYEQLRIYERRGKLVFAAMPSGQPAAEFEVAELGDSVVVFENPRHDFPQRILYCRVGLDSMLARVEGVSKGKQRAVSFPYVHIACPSGGPAPTSPGTP